MFALSPENVSEFSIHFDGLGVFNERVGRGDGVESDLEASSFASDVAELDQTASFLVGRQRVDRRSESVAYSFESLLTSQSSEARDSSRENHFGLLEARTVRSTMCQLHRSPSPWRSAKRMRRDSPERRRNRRKTFQSISRHLVSLVNSDEAIDFTQSENSRDHLRIGTW